MSLDELRYYLLECRQSIDQEAKLHKDSYAALTKLSDLYEAFDVKDRRLADEVLSEWLLSDQEALRFDAQHLIRVFGIANASPALEILAQRLASSKTPGAPFELEKVRRLIVQIGRQGHETS